VFTYTAALVGKKEERKKELLHACDRRTINYQLFVQRVLKKDKFCFVSFRTAISLCLVVFFLFLSNRKQFITVPPRTV
jgi:hypothetical protein